MKSKSIVIAIATLLLAMTSLQGGATLAKQLFTEIGPIGATTLRIIFAATILVLVFKPFPITSAKDIKAIAFYGCSLGFMNLLFYLAIERIPLGIAVALEFTGPLAVALFSSQKISDSIYAVFAGLGIYLVLPVSTTVDLDWFGIFCALGAGFFWALYILFGKIAGALMHQGKVTAIGMVFAALTVLPFGIYHTGFGLLTLHAFPIALAVAILSSAIPYTLEMFALSALPKRVFGTLMSLEPAVAACIGLLFLSESLTLQQMIAILCIMIASAGSALSLRERALPQ